MAIAIATLVPAKKRYSGYANTWFVYAKKYSGYVNHKTKSINYENTTKIIQKKHFPIIVEPQVPGTG